MWQHLARLALVGMVGSSIGCSEGPTASTVKVHGGMSSTAAAGLTNPAPAVRGNLGALKFETEYSGFDFELKTRQDADVIAVTVLGGPGSHSGWHYHPGPAIVIVRTGTITSYVIEDGVCRTQRYAAGSAFLEGTAPHIIRNEGAEDIDASVVFFTPAGAPPRIDIPDPEIC